VSIAHQIATPTPAARTRRPSAPLQLAPVPHPGAAVARILGLLTVAALGAALLAGALAIGLMTFVSSMGG
jgi:hypothetical protein